MSERDRQVYRGARMTGLQYEALCRHAISRIYGVPIDQIHGGHLAGASNRRQKVRHQIDLYWDTSDGVLTFKVFANAKWRTENVKVREIMELIGVWRDIGAHKAMLITNSGFDIGVRRQAEEKGIGLLIVRPVVDFEGLGRRNLPGVVAEVERIAGERGEAVFAAEVVHKGALPLEARAGEKVSSGAGEGGEGVSGREGEGATADGGMWLVGGVGGEGEVEGVENKSMGSGEISNKMIGGK